MDIAEARFDLRDLRVNLSNTLVPYIQQTGKVVIKERDRTRQIELRARISKRLLGQERLQLGSNRHLGEHIPIQTRDQFARAGNWLCHGKASSSSVATPPQPPREIADQLPERIDNAALEMNAGTARTGRLGFEFPKRGGWQRTRQPAARGAMEGI